ncbi:MAG: hypothetical protein IJJ26_11160 [Victivallales bacterium]|nr:hypothetical protein [Victivallales bacterium]
MSMASEERIVLVDAYAHIYRCFFAIRAGLTNPRGEPTNALYGIARFLLQLHRSMGSSHGAFVFDKGKITRRVEICPEYKAQRPPMPDTMRPQIAPIREWIDAFGWPILEQEGLEADDLIAAVTRRREALPVTICTKDKDIMQLTTDPQVTIAQPEKDSWKILGAAEVAEHFGVKPEQILDYLSLLGDTADNIIGVPGVGAKTASKLLGQFGSIAEMLAHLDQMPSPKIAQSLEASRELLKRNQCLVALDDTPPASWQGLPTIVRNEPDWARLVSLAKDQGFQSLVPTFQKEADAGQQLSFF